MAQAAVPDVNATTVGAFVAFSEYPEHNGYKIIVSKHFRLDESNRLMNLQVQAIKAGAMWSVQSNTLVNMAAWTTETQPRPCLHLNFCPIQRESFDYVAFTPLSLVEKGGFVVAGVCVTSLSQISQLRQYLTSIPLGLDQELERILERLGSRLETNCIRDDCQDTLDRSISTTSATCLPHALTNTREVKGEESAVTAQGSNEHCDQFEMPTTQFYLSGRSFTPPASKYLIANLASDDIIQTNLNHRFPGTEPAKLPLTKRSRSSKACEHCHKTKAQCKKPFPCERCARLGIKCTPRQRKMKTMLKPQNTLSQQSPFRSTTNSSSVPTAIPSLWTGPDLGAMFFMDTQCGPVAPLETRHSPNDPKLELCWESGHINM